MVIKLIKVGTGAYGVVASAEDLKNDKKKLAIKKIINPFEHKDYAI